jgi:hypothetical protein
MATQAHIRAAPITAEVITHRATVGITLEGTAHRIVAAATRTLEPAITMGTTNRDLFIPPRLAHHDRDPPSDASCGALERE